MLIANHLAHQANGHAKIMGWLRAWAPEMSREDAEAIADRAVANPRKYRADTLAKRVGLTAVERSALGITTIGAIDQTKEQREERRRRKNAEAKRAARAASNSGRSRGRPKSEDIPAWQAAGFTSKRTYHRHKASGTKNAGTAYVGTPYAADGISVPLSRAEKALAEGRRKPELHHAKTVTEGLGARCREPTNQNVSEEDRELNAMIGLIERTIGHKSRMSERMPLSRKARAYALAACFTPAQVESMFATFRDWNIAKGTYSADWDDVWIRWVDREVDLVTARYNQDQTRAWFERRAA